MAPAPAGMSVSFDTICAIVARIVRIPKGLAAGTNAQISRLKSLNFPLPFLETLCYSDICMNVIDDLPSGRNPDQGREYKMDEQTQLKEALHGLLTLADASDRRLQAGQVEKECAALGLDARQTRLVCAYLEMNHIHIEGFAASEEDKSLFRDAVDAAGGQREPAAADGEAKPGEDMSDKDKPGKGKSDQERSGSAGSGKRGSQSSDDETGAGSAYYRMYLAELQGVRPCTDEEESALVDMLLTGSDSDRETARERLVEGNLHRVVQISRTYLGQGVLAADLVQEGNMALFMAVDSYAAQAYRAGGDGIYGEPAWRDTADCHGAGADFRLYLIREIEAAMVEAIREQTGSDDILNTLAADANALMKATEDLADRLGREATSEELATHLHMSRERVETLVKISLDAMNISNE